MPAFTLIVLVIVLAILKLRVVLILHRVWTEFHEEIDAGGVDHVIATDLHLEPGRTYRAVVKFCHPGGCFLVRYPPFSAH